LYFFEKLEPLICRALLEPIKLPERQIKWFKLDVEHDHFYALKKL